jgi:tetratricopeptide (TPR) repeat protein
LLLFCLLFLALALRLAALASLATSPYGDALLWDERYYHDWARQLVSGGFLSTAPYRAAPLPAYLMAGVYALLGPESGHIRLLHVLLGTLTCSLIYLTGRELAGRTVGLLAALLAALYKPLIFFSTVPLKTTQAVCLFAAALYLLLVGLRRPRWPAVAALGAVLGLLINVQGNALLLVPIVLLCLGTECLRSRPGEEASPRASRARLAALVGLAYLAGLLFTTAPVALRNYRVAGSLVLTTPQAGFALYAGNRLDNPDPYFRPVPFAVPDPAEQLVQMTIEAGRRAGSPLSVAQASRFWARETLHEAWQQPWAAVGKLLWKALALLNPSETCDHYHVGFLAEFVPVLRLPLLPFWTLLPLAAAGAVIALRASRLGGHLLLVLGAYAATLILFYPGARFRLPLVAGLLPLAGCALQAGLLRLRRREPRLLVWPAAAAVGGALLLLPPVPGAGDLAAFYNTHAILLFERGRTAEAVEFWQTSSRLGQPYSAFATLALAGLAVSGGEYQAALRSLERIPDGSFAAALAQDLRGDLELRRGRLLPAAAAYERALAVNTALRETREKLIWIYRQTDPGKAAQQRALLDQISAFYPGG